VRAEHLAQRGGGAVPLLPARREERVREFLAGPRQRPPSSLDLGSLILLFRRLSGESSGGLGVDRISGAALPGRTRTRFAASLRRGLDAVGGVARAAFHLALQTVALARRELRQVRGVHLLLGVVSRLHLHLVHVLLADQVVHVHELVHVEIGLHGILAGVVAAVGALFGALRFPAVFVLGGAFQSRVEGHTEPLFQGLLGEPQPLGFAQLFLGIVLVVVRPSEELLVPGLGGEERRGALQHAHDVKLGEREVAGGVVVVVGRRL
jgi:hypothetical protein